MNNDWIAAAGVVAILVGVGGVFGPWWALMVGGIALVVLAILRAILAIEGPKPDA